MHTEPPVISFQEDLTAAFQEVRTALAELLATAGADQGSLNDVSRRLGLNRSLAWKIGRVLGEDDIYTAIQHLPGEEGIEILSAAMERVGAGSQSLNALRSAMARFDQVVRIHAGDR